MNSYNMAKSLSLSLSLLSLSLSTILSLVVVDSHWLLLLILSWVVVVDIVIGCRHRYCHWLSLS